MAKKNHHSKPSGKGSKPVFYKKKKREVTFDPEARRDYLRGFSERKRQRRAYGLAMQKVKDRQSKLEERKETKQAELERIEQAEQQKQDLLAETFGLPQQQQQDGNGSDSSEERRQGTRTTMYHDMATQSQFGGQVIVTTTTLAPSDDESDNDDLSSAQAKHSIDSRQRYAGNVSRFMDELKGNLPGKHKDHSHHTKHKGKHGAAEMSGMGGVSNLRIAQKALFKIQAKQGKPGPGGKRKRGKHKR